jgi:hypothetical protein
MLIVPCLIPWLALAQPASAPAPTEAPIIGAAQDDAFAQLDRTIDALPLTTNQTLGDLFNNMPDENLALRRILQKRAQPIAHRLYSDGSADVDLAIAMDHLRQAIDQVKKSSPHLQKQWPDAVQFNPSGDPPLNRLVATGVAMPAIVPLTLEPAASQPARLNPAPPPLLGWRHVSETDRRLTADAARAHALHRLFEQIKAMPIDAGRTIRTFLLNNPAQLPRRRAALAADATFKIDYDPTGICIAHVDVPSQTARQWLPQTLARRVIPQDVLSASGLAEPPPRSNIANSPNWINENLSATATSRLDSTAPQADLARRAAVALAKRRLTQKIDQLTLPTGQSVRDAILARPQLAPDFKTFLSSARPTQQDASDGRSTVTLTIPLRRLYLLLAPTVFP